MFVIVLFQLVFYTSTAAFCFFFIVFAIKIIHSSVRMRHVHYLEGIRHMGSPILVSCASVVRISLQRKRRRFRGRRVLVGSDYL